MNELNEMIKSGNLLIWIAGSICLEIIISYINILLFSQVFNVNINKATREKIIIIITFAKMLYVSIFPKGIYKILEIITLIILFKITTKINFEKCVIGGILVSMIRIILDMIFVSLYDSIFFGNVFISEYYNYKYHLLSGLSVAMSLTIIYLILKSVKFKLKITDAAIMQNSNLIKIFILVGIGIHAFNLCEYLNACYHIDFKFFAVNITLVVMYMYVFKELSGKLSNLEEYGEEIKCLEAHNEILLTQNDNMRSIKHDISNFLLVLSGYAKVNNINGIKKLLEKEVNEVISNNNLSSLSPKLINNPAIYNILVKKFMIAKKEDVNMRVEVTTSLKNEKFESYEFYKIFGILVDNAIEAAAKCEEKYVNIKFEKNKSKKQYVVIIENSYNNYDVDISKIFEKGYTSKKENKESHGIGLWNVNCILKKNKNIELFTTKDTMFRQQIELY